MTFYLLKHITTTSKINFLKINKIKERERETKNANIERNLISKYFYFVTLSRSLFVTQLLVF
jgi:hypothetical protein